MINNEKLAGFTQRTFWKANFDDAKTIKCVIFLSLHSVVNFNLKHKLLTTTVDTREYAYVTCPILMQIMPEERIRMLNLLILEI